MHETKDGATKGTGTTEILEQLKAGVEALKTSEQWQEYLKALSAFHHYSLNNVMLIHFQRPGATRVAGFRTWKKLGRYVKKGEHGIRILAPMVRKRREAEDLDDEAPQVLVGFRTVAVFDVGQTDGEPLPEEKVYQPLAGQEERARALFEDLATFATGDLGIPVSVEPIEGRAHGYLKVDAPRRIVVREGNSPLHQVKTLAHELGHALLHFGKADDMHERPQMEVEAESVAFVVMTRLGLDTAGYSFPYVAGWAEGDADQVMKSAERIQQAARRILDRILSAEKDEAQEAAA